MDKKELAKRTKLFALEIIKLVQSLPKNKVCDVIGYQIMKSGTSIGANYREAIRGVSKRDFICKIGIVEKEASETLYWLELLQESGIVGAIVFIENDIACLDDNLAHTRDSITRVDH